MVRKKIGSERKFEIDNFKIKIGTTDKWATRVFFVEYAGKIKSDSRILNDNFCKTIKDWLTKNKFYDFVMDNKTIVDVDNPEKFNDGLSYVNFKTFNCLKCISEFGNIADNVESTIKNKIIPQLKELIG